MRVKMNVLCLISVICCGGGDTDNYDHEDFAFLPSCSDEIRGTISQNLNQFRSCLSVNTPNGSSVSGRIEIEVDIDFGSVSTNINQNTTGNVLLEECIQQKIESWRFSEDCVDVAVLPIAFYQGTVSVSLNSTLTIFTIRSQH